MLTKEEIKEMEIISSGHTVDLIYQDTVGTQIWVSRMRVEDGQPYDDQVTVIACINGRSKIVHQYEPE